MKEYRRVLKDNYPLYQDKELIKGYHFIFLSSNDKQVVFQINKRRFIYTAPNKLSISDAFSYCFEQAKNVLLFDICNKIPTKVEAK